MTTKNNKKDISEKSLQLYLKEIEQYSDLKLTPEEEKELFKKVEKGDEGARKKIARAYLVLVVKIAQYYAPRTKKLTTLVLVQEGNLGLYRTIELFNPQSTYRFSTFATLMIREAIFEAFKKTEEIRRMKEAISEAISKISEEVKKGRKKLFKDEGVVILEKPKRKKITQGEKIIWESKIKKSIIKNKSEIIELLSKVTPLERVEAKKEIEKVLEE